jgi:hypothetical protein
MFAIPVESGWAVVQSGNAAEPGVDHEKVDDDVPLAAGKVLG